MVDRVGLLEVVFTRASLPVAQATLLNRLLDRALAIALAELDLQAARTLPPARRGELESALRELLTIPDLRKVAKRWEPQRRLGADMTQTEITDGLAALLHGTRQPYVPCTRPLPQARALTGADRAELDEHIARWAPAADLRRLAARWDRNNKPLAQSTRTGLAAGLLALLNGRTEPLTG
jgi:hypothetical protein